MDNNQEGNLVSLKIFLTKEGTIMSELSYLPLGCVREIFQKEDVDIIEKVITEGRKKLEPLHEYLEKEIQAL